MLTYEQEYSRTEPFGCQHCQRGICVSSIVGRRVYQGNTEKRMVCRKKQHFTERKGNSKTGIPGNGRSKESAGTYAVSVQCMGENHA